MKYAIVLFICFTINNFIMAQEKNAYKDVAAQFEKNYNAQDYDAVFNSFSPEMQAALPLAQAKEFFNSLHTQLGKIKTHDFTIYKQSYAIYKTAFERGIMAVNISVDDKNKINGLSIRPYTETEAPKIERNITPLDLPFKNEWTVFWGGDTEALNYHVKNAAQKNAFDFIITDKDGKSYKTDGKDNEDYYAFGQRIISPCDGEVVLAVDGIIDNVPGRMNPVYAPGNTVIVKTANNEYLFFAHLKQSSIVVKQNQKITKGQLLGLCGNTGNSSEPHLHFHLQNVEDINMATGIKCYFDAINVNGKTTKDYSPVKGERVSAVR